MMIAAFAAGALFGFFFGLLVTVAERREARDARRGVDQEIEAAREMTMQLGEARRSVPRRLVVTHQLDGEWIDLLRAEIERMHDDNEPWRE